MSFSRLIICMLACLAGASGIALAAAEDADGLARACREAFYEIDSNTRRSIERELTLVEFYAKHDQAYNLCARAEDAGSVNARLFLSLLTFGFRRDLQHLRFADYAGNDEQPKHLLEVPEGYGLSVGYAYEFLREYYTARKAYRLLLSAARDGDPEAQYFASYEMNRGVNLLEGGWPVLEQDEDQARQMMQLAAEGGNPDAQFQHGARLLSSTYVINPELGHKSFKKTYDADGNWARDELEHAEGLEQLVKAAGQGNGLAMYFLIMFVYNLKGNEGAMGPLDLANVEKYCRKALTEGYPSAAAYSCADRLGRNYADPPGQPYSRDYYASAYWLTLMRNRLVFEGELAEGNPLHLSSLEVLKESRAKLSDEQIARLEEETSGLRASVCKHQYYREKHAYRLPCSREQG